MGEGKKELSLNLKIWRQDGPRDQGRMEDFKLDHVSPDMSFLEMLDLLNENLMLDGQDPIAFDHDCREGICGMCSLNINGTPHGPMKATTTCQLHMRSFKNGDTIFIEPFKASAFPVIKDLTVDRTAFDKIIQAGGFVSINAGNAPDAHANVIPKRNAELSMDAAACIGCGACVASCKNASGMLFLSAKVSHLNLLPQGEPEAARRVVHMVNAHDEAGLGACTNTGSCEAACPKEIKLSNIGRLNREYYKASFLSEEV